MLGGGGITPDYIVKVDNLTEYAAKMRARLFEFISGYMDKNGPAFRQKYGKDQAQRFTNEFTVDEELLASFVSFGESKSIPLVKDQYQKDLDYIKALIKAQIARNLFGNEGFFRALLQADPQFRKARTLFPEAKKIAGLK